MRIVIAIESKFPDDEIDLRDLIHTLFRKKWFILGITLVAAVTAFVYSRYGLPTRYTAQAQVLITKPLYTTNLESRIQSIPQTPEASVLKDLALAQDLLWSVYTSPDVTAVLDKGMSFEQFTANMSAKLAGTSKLFLGVSSTDPKISATIVNVWADKFATRINSLYSVNEKVLTIIEKEAQNARQKWDAAEQTLMEKLPDGIVETRKIELENKQNTLFTYLDTLTQLDLLTSDAQSLQLRLDA